MNPLRSRMARCYLSHNLVLFLAAIAKFTTIQVCLGFTNYKIRGPSFYRGNLGEIDAVTK